MKPLECLENNKHEANTITFTIHANLSVSDMLVNKYK